MALLRARTSKRGHASGAHRQYPDLACNLSSSGFCSGSAEVAVLSHATHSAGYSTLHSLMAAMPLIDKCLLDMPTGK